MGLVHTTQIMRGNARDVGRRDTGTVGAVGQWRARFIQLRPNLDTQFPVTGSVDREEVNRPGGVLSRLVRGAAAKR